MCLSFVFLLSFPLPFLQVFSYILRNGEKEIGGLGFRGPTMTTGQYGYMENCFFLFVLGQLFITRYMQPEGLWQRLCRCPLQGNGGVLYKETFSDPEPACAVIVRYPCTPTPHIPPYTRKEKKDKHVRKKRKGKKRRQKSPRSLLLHLHNRLSGSSPLWHSNLHLISSSPWVAVVRSLGTSGPLPFSLRFGDGELHPLASTRASLLAAQASARAP